MLKKHFTFLPHLLFLSANFMLPSLFVTFLQRFFRLSDSVSFCVTCSQAQLQAASSPGQRSEVARPGIEPDADPQLIISSPQPQPPGFYTDSRSLFSFPLFISACLGGNTDPSRLSVKYLTSWWKNSTTSFQFTWIWIHVNVEFKNPL